MSFLFVSSDMVDQSFRCCPGGLGSGSGLGFGWVSPWYSNKIESPTQRQIQELMSILLYTILLCGLPIHGTRLIVNLRVLECIVGSWFVTSRCAHGYPSVSDNFISEALSSSTLLDYPSRSIYPCLSPLSSVYRLQGTSRLGV